jgi:hypothetical protein
MESNVRYGVVNVVDRTNFEKKFHINCAYELITYDKMEAVKYARALNNSDYIVERIFNTKTANNFREEIYRSGKEA